MQHLDTDAAVEWLRYAVRVRGVAPLARLLRMSRASISTVLAGTARHGTVLQAALAAQPYLGTAPRNLPIPPARKRANR